MKNKNYAEYRAYFLTIKQALKDKDFSLDTLKKFTEIIDLLIDDENENND